MPNQWVLFHRMKHLSYPKGKNELPRKPMFVTDHLPIIGVRWLQRSLFTHGNSLVSSVMYIRRCEYCPHIPQGLHVSKARQSSPVLLTEPWMIRSPSYSTNTDWVSIISVLGTVLGTGVEYLMIFPKQCLTSETILCTQSWKPQHQFPLQTRVMHEDKELNQIFYAKMLLYRVFCRMGDFSPTCQAGKLAKKNPLI